MSSVLIRPRLIDDSQLKADTFRYNLLYSTSIGSGLNNPVYKKSKSFSYRQLNSSVLKLLFWLRNIGIILQIAVIFTAVQILDMPLDLQPLATIILLQASWNLVLWWRTRQHWPFSNQEVTLNLIIDLLALAGLFYFAGGSTNPFVSLFIVPVALGAVFLPVSLLSGILILAMALYTLLLEWYIPLPEIHHHIGDNFHLHVIGMWANFIFSAVILAIFVYVLANRGRKYQQALADTREKLLRNQHILKVGTMAASAAHELNTPLSSIHMLASELIETSGDKDTIDDAQEIVRQVIFCKEQLMLLQGQVNDAQAQPFASAIIEILRTWLASRPEIKLEQLINISDSYILPSELSSVITNLLDNAADASVKAGSHYVCISAKIDNDEAIVDIDDQGAGLSEQQISTLGKTSYTDKPDGMGLGLMLSHASLEQLHGQLQLIPLQPVGTRARIVFPIQEINLPTAENEFIDNE